VLIIKYGTGFIIALVVDEKCLDVESHSLMLVSWQKATSRSHFLRNPTFGVIYTQQKDFLANLELQVSEPIFWNF